MSDQLDLHRVRAAIAAIASRQHGVITNHQLIASGLSKSGISDWVRQGRLHRIHRGVYAVGHPNLTLEGRFLAAVKACGPHAALSHFYAAVLWGLLEPLPRDPDVTAATGREHPRINTHRSASLLDAAVVHWASRSPLRAERSRTSGAPTSRRRRSSEPRAGR
jgi:predicted transcriptional regulator of viral defense system